MKGFEPRSKKHQNQGGAQREKAARYKDEWSKTKERSKVNVRRKMKERSRKWVMES